MIFAFYILKIDTIYRAGQEILDTVYRKQVLTVEEQSKPARLCML